jgi:hypothetical protein
MAARLRRQGATVVFAPMGMLHRNYAVSGWFRRRSRLSSVAKRLGVRVLRHLWARVAHWFVCLSAEEMHAAMLPTERCLVAPWATPPSSLGRAALDRTQEEGSAAESAPVAFVSRMDPHRKGLDRMFAWLDANRDELPRPAVKLFAPSGPNDPTRLARLEAEGLVEWDRHTSGADLLQPLVGCRGAMLLSRWEAQSRFLREALLLGLPILTTSPSSLEEAMRLCGAGEAVDGDDVQQVHAAFGRMGRRGSAETAQRVFDRQSIGEFLFHNFAAVRERGDPCCRDYYDGVEPTRPTAGAAKPLIEAEL